MDTFPLGGIAKSLLALFNELGNRYDIDFLLMRKEGLFLPMIPDNVHLLKEPIASEYRNPHPKLVLRNYKALSLREWLRWCSFSLTCSVGQLRGGLHRKVQSMDEWLGKHTTPLKKHYDAAIAYQGGRCIYYLIQNVDADVKIGYVHSDYLNNETDYMLYRTDKKYFPTLDSLVTISEKCVESLRKAFPDMLSKIKVVENICSPTMIRSMANEFVPFEEYTGLKLLTMGRLDWEVKGLDFIVDAAENLKSKGIDFRWYLLGDGHSRKRLEEAIAQRLLDKHVLILGAKTNPYPYISACDIYVHPSRVEGKSVALDEVKALAKPVVVTDFSTVFDQFRDNVTALICKKDPDDIVKSIILLANNPNERKRLTSNLQSEKIGNCEQVDIFESLLTK